MKDFVIEYELEKVKNNKTREYLTEVVSDYTNGNYRSAIVVLYSVLIYDLLAKLKILDEIYTDKVAKDILDKVKKEQQAHPKSPSWEKILLDEISKKTELISNIEMVKITHLIDDRNFSAHPLYDNNFELVNPSAENVRYHLRNMFEISFQKESLLSKKIKDELLADISEFYKRQELYGFEEYIFTKYYSKLNQNVKNKLFKSFWKLVFVVDDSECNANRNINLQALLILVKEDPDLYLEIVKEQSTFYDNIMPGKFNFEKTTRIFKGNDSRIVCFIRFLSEYPNFYNVLNESSKKIIEVAINKNINLKISGYFSSDSINDHINDLKKFHKEIFIENSGYVHGDKYNCMTPKALMKLLSIAEERYVSECVIDFILDYFLKTPTWSAATEIYNELIMKILEKLKQKQFEKLLDGMNENNQIYGNRDLKEKFESLKVIAKKILGSDCELDKYDKLW